MFLSPVTESAQSIHDTTNPLHKPPRRHRFASCRLDTDDILGRSSRVTAISLSSRERCCHVSFGLRLKFETLISAKDKVTDSQHCIDATNISVVTSLLT